MDDDSQPTPVQQASQCATSDCIPPQGCFIPPIITVSNRPVNIYNEHIDRPGREIIITKACKLVNTNPIYTSYSPCKSLFAIGYDNILQVYDLHCNLVIQQTLPSGRVIQGLDFDHRLLVASSNNTGTLFVSIFESNLTLVDTISFNGLKFGSIKGYNSYILMSYTINTTESEFKVITSSTLQNVKTYVRCTVCPIDFLHVCPDILLVYDNKLELIKAFEEVGKLVTLPSKITSIVGEHWFYCFNFIVACEYCTEDGSPSLLDPPNLTLTPGDTNNLRFYTINKDGMFIKGKTKIIGDPKALSLTKDKQSVAMVIGETVVIYDLVKWCSILCGTSFYIGTGLDQSIIWNGNNNLVVTSNYKVEFNNFLCIKTKCI